MAPRRPAARPTTRTTALGLGTLSRDFLSRELAELPRAMQARQSRIARARAQSHGGRRVGKEGVRRKEMEQGEEENEKEEEEEEEQEEEEEGKDQERHRHL
eukprot:7255029-Pyramimonas_sp.AAC.1